MTAKELTAAREAAGLTVPGIVGRGREYKSKRRKQAMTKAQIILEQLGGNKFMVMTGAKNLAGGQDYLSFGIMKNRGKITHVKIRLNSLDLYDYTFYTIRGTKIKALDIVDNVPVENLRSMFTDKTGLDTSL